MLYKPTETTQSPVVFHFQLSETERKQFALDEGDAEIKSSTPIDIKGAQCLISVF